MDGLLSLLLFAVFFYVMMRFGCGAHMVHGHGGHGQTDRHQNGHGEHTPDPPAPGPSTVIDPVCGMEVPPGKGYTVVHEGREYRLCSRACLDTFEARPQQYAASTGGVR